ncbi:hypothetical protein M569_05388 [Genlisea aurea]|uniref:Chromo domain-containing protein n=1 Tax=Genlisea aurea TaxID=192259 RepID=S8E190_9LAMI|nr:hypothetical protein M569_05388 [Genlisea aurea]
MVSSSNGESGSDGGNSSGNEPISRSKCAFSEGEKVLAYHGPRIYEAKATLILHCFLGVQKAEVRKNEWRYYVHYLGWNKNWDEWVGTDRLLKHNEKNILEQKALDKKAGVDKNTKTGRPVQTKGKGSTGMSDKEETRNTAGRRNKRKAVASIQDNPATEKRVKIQIPPQLKKQLVDDWEFITQQNKLVKLPRSPSVDEILTEYLEYRSKKDGMVSDAVGEILNGLRCYFDKALPAILLYKNERQQFREALTNDASPSSVYGAEHLLRIFVKLPELLGHVRVEEETLVQLQQKLVEFLRFLQSNQTSFFLSDYYDGPKV